MSICLPHSIIKNNLSYYKEINLIYFMWLLTTNSHGYLTDNFPIKNAHFHALLLLKNNINILYFHLAELFEKSKIEKKDHIALIQNPLEDYDDLVKKLYPLNDIKTLIGNNSNKQILSAKTHLLKLSKHLNKLNRVCSKTAIDNNKSVIFPSPSKWNEISQANNIEIKHNYFIYDNKFPLETTWNAKYSRTSLVKKEEVEKHMKAIINHSNSNFSIKNEIAHLIKKSYTKSTFRYDPSNKDDLNILCSNINNNGNMIPIKNNDMLSKNELNHLYTQPNKHTSKNNTNKTMLYKNLLTLYNALLESVNMTRETLKCIELLKKIEILNSYIEEIKKKKKYFCSMFGVNSIENYILYLEGKLAIIPGTSDEMKTIFNKYNSKYLSTYYFVDLITILETLLHKADEKLKSITKFKKIYENVLKLPENFKEKHISYIIFSDLIFFVNTCIDNIKKISIVLNNIDTTIDSILKEKENNDMLKNIKFADREDKKVYIDI